MDFAKRFFPYRYNLGVQGCRLVQLAYRRVQPGQTGQAGGISGILLAVYLFIYFFRLQA